jgi:hypothetical protein
MEFHNVKLLPKGLPEIISAFMPYELHPTAKVVVYSQKDMVYVGNVYHHRRGRLLGYCGLDDVTNSPYIGLYPTQCCAGGGHRFEYHGTESFELWMSLLDTTLHEIGHLATDDVRIGEPCFRYEDDLAYHHAVEEMADRWKYRAMNRLLRDNPRLGQPLGALTGYLGVLAYRFRKVAGKWNPARVAEWRGSDSGGQLSMSDLINITIHWVTLPGVSWEASHYGKDSTVYHFRRRRIAGRRVYDARRELGITRCHVSKTGKQYPMFNAAEAEQVSHWLQSSYRVVETPVVETPCVEDEIPF